MSVEVAIRGFKIAPANTTEIVHRGTFKRVVPTVFFGITSDIPHKFEILLTKTGKKHVFPLAYN